jgi:hypothetical protein
MEELIGFKIDMLKVTAEQVVHVHGKFNIMDA